MAEHHSLQYWLESINLPQYYMQFVNCGLITREQFASLDEQKLVEIGVTLPGHQRRILSHLPDESTWVEDRTTLPNLPPKKKSFRDSYLYETKKPPDCSSAQTGMETSRDGAKDQPRPMPRARNRLSQPQSPAATPNEEKPKPVKRPTPAPRKLTKTEGTQSMGCLHNKEEKNEPLKNRLSYNELRSQNNAGENMQNFNASVKLEGVCIHESSTDNVSLSEMYSTPDKRKEKEEVETLSESDIYSFPIKKKTPEEAQTDIESDSCVREKQSASLNDSERANSDEIYVNLDDTDEGGIDTPDIPDKNVTKEVAGASYIETTDRKEKYENAEFDPIVGMYKVRTEEAIFRSDSPVANNGEHDKYMSENFSKSEAEIECSNDGIYEPIWEDKGQDVTKPAGKNRVSSLMQFPSLDLESNSVITRPKEKSYSVNSQVAQNRISSSRDRESVLFDMPPPRFAPPPLPLSMQDVIADFDPLNDPVQPAMPPVPPRPANYSAPKGFRTYENVTFPMGGESSTLPGHRSDIEPDMLVNSPKQVPYQDAFTSGTEDPFKNEDPFGQFEPDCDDFDPTSFLPSSCDKEQQIKGFEPDTEAIYEAAEDPDAFDPFGLNREQSQRSLPRSVSSGSSGSQYRLSEVPPAPRCFHASPDTGRLYSVAVNLSKCTCIFFVRTIFLFLLRL